MKLRYLIALGGLLATMALAGGPPAPPTSDLRSFLKTRPDITDRVPARHLSPDEQVRLRRQLSDFSHPAQKVTATCKPPHSCPRPD